MQQLIICKGLPASGKSSFSREWVGRDAKKRVIVSRDSIRRMLGPYWVPSREDLVTDIENSMIVQSLINRFDVIVDATNLKGIDRFKKLLKSYNLESITEILVEDFTHVDVNTCIERDKLRDDSERVGKEIILNMYNKYLKNNG